LLFSFVNSTATSDIHTLSLHDALPISENFSPYQHRQARIIEFPATLRTFAQAFANTMPFSEAIGFIADVDEENPNAVDYPFSVVDRKSTRLNSSHVKISYAVFCLKKKT